jgi:alpha-glucuronidase
VLLLAAMLETSIVSDGCFEWLRVLRYHMDIQNVLRAKTEAVEIKGQSPAVPSVRSRMQQKRMSLVTKIRMEPTLGNAEKKKLKKKTQKTKP